MGHFFAKPPRWMLALGAVLSVVARMQVVEATRPRATPLRHDENWVATRGTPDALAWPGWLKDVPIREDSDWRKSLGLETRLRYELLTNPNWGNLPEDSDGYLWTRILPFLELQNEEVPLRLFTQLNLAYSADVDPEPGSVDEDRADFLQLFVDLGDPYAEDGHRLRMGRQVLALGSQRLVGTRYGVNVIQSFDSAELTLVGEEVSTRLLYARPTRFQLGAFDNEPSNLQQLWGAYSTLAVDDYSGMDAYYLGFLDEQAVFQQIAGREVRHSLGVRYFGEVDAWTWNLEGVVQFGSIDAADIAAWTASFNVARVLERLPQKPVFDLKFDLISGDDDTADGTVETFNPLFPSLKYFGESGVIAPYNLIDLHPTITVPLGERFALSGNIDFLWRFSTDDALYGPGGQILRDGSLSSSRYVATQYELSLETELAPGLSTFVSWTTLPPGDFIRESGRSDTIHFAAVEALWAF